MTITIVLLSAVLAGAVFVFSVCAISAKRKPTQTDDPIVSLADLLKDQPTTYHCPTELSEAEARGQLENLYGYKEIVLPSGRRFSK